VSAASADAFYFAVIADTHILAATADYIRGLQPKMERVLVASD
jgi:hypothetical protein